MIPRGRRPSRWPLLLLWSLFVFHPARAAGFAYRVAIDAPPPFRKLLENNLQIVTWRGNRRMALATLRSVFRKTPERILTLMEAEGYYSPTIDTSLSARAGQWVVRLRVVPNAPSRVATLRLTLAGALSADPKAYAQALSTLRGRWQVKPGEVFRTSDWESAKRRALLTLWRRYPGARLAFSRATVDPQTRRVALEAAFDSGPLFTFGRVTVAGLHRYSPALVENYDPIAPGEPYSQAKLLEFQRGLQDSGYFLTAYVTAQPHPTGARQVPIRVQVVENPSRKLTFGVGYDTDLGALLEGDYEDHNLLRRAWDWKNVLKLQTKAQSVTTQLLLPAPLNAYHYGASINFTRSNLAGLVNTAFAAAGQRTRTTPRRVSTQSLQYLVDHNEIAGVPSTTDHALMPDQLWTFRHVNNLLYPQRGYMATFEIGAGAKTLASDQNFVRSHGKAIVFAPLDAHAEDILILRGEYGVVAAPSRAGIPLALLFRAGGDSSIRGYAYQSIGVHEAGAIVGGRYLLDGSVEIDHWFTPQWGGAMFYDAGNAADSVRDLRPFFSGYGVGARWRSPVGPINVDLAYGRETRAVRLHFAVGFTF